MPTHSLIAGATDADGWHGVGAPGGYEWWYFDGEDGGGEVQIVGIILDGFVFHPGYLRRHFRYLRNPTKHAPAVARDFPCAYFVIYDKGKIAAQFMTQYPAGTLVAAADGVRVEMGTNSLVREDGEYRLQMQGTPWKLTGRGPQTLMGQRLSVDWRVSAVSVHAAEERRFLSREMTGAEHHWVLAAPHGTFEAVVKLQGGPGDREWRLKGRGYHDHNYGTGPLGPGLKRWIWGRALFDDACYTFHYAVPRDGGLPAEVHVLRVTPGGGVKDVSPKAEAVLGAFDRRSGVMGGFAGYPGELDLGVIKLSQPKVVDASPFYMRMVYRAECQGRVGTAFCEAALPERLRWPLLGRMIEMSFDKRK